MRGLLFFMGKETEQYLNIPPYILSDGRLDPTKIILMSEIINLNKTPKGCYASNKRFGKLLGINPDGASKKITSLKKIGFIQTEFKNGYRYIKVLNQSDNQKNIQSDIFINIPYSVLFDINLSSTQKLLLSEIIALIQLPDGCYKSNNDFGELIGIGGSGISKQINKLVEMNYITTEEIKIGNATDHRKIELTTSYKTREVLPKSQEGTSQTNIGVVPKSQEGTSCRNTITTVYNSIEVFPVLAQFTSTENKIDLTEIEQLILNSCVRGEKLLEQAKKKSIDNYWHFGNSNQEVEYLKKIVNEYQDAKNNKN